MDGTEGSALYKVPFQLPKKPSSLWTELFIYAWRRLPRSQIASVNGDMIILDGTTIEEVRNYYRETLLLCVELANKQEKEILKEQKLEEEAEKRREE